MKKSERNFTSKDGKSKMRAIIYEPVGEAKGILQVVHGMSEYIDRYADFMEYLCARGWICCAMIIWAMANWPPRRIWVILPTEMAGNF